MIIYQELTKYFEKFNDMFEECLGNRLELDDIIFTLQRKNKILGYFAHKNFESQDGLFKHEISLNPEYFTVKPKIEVLRVFCQELLQLYRVEHGDPETLKIGFYDEEWGEFMMCVGLMPSRTGKPDGKETGKKMSSYILPDGAFIKLCNELAEQGLLIEWFDKIPAKYEIEHLMQDLYEIRDLIDLKDVHPALIEVPILKRKNIDVFNFMGCLERNENNKKIELNTAKALETNIISKPAVSPQVLDDEELYGDQNEAEVDLAKPESDAIKSDNDGNAEYIEYRESSTFADSPKDYSDDDIQNNNLDDDLPKEKPKKEKVKLTQVDLVDVINQSTPVGTKEQLAEIIGIEKPKPPTKRSSFKYTCGCENEVVANKEHLRFTCNSCQMAYRCETEKFATDVVKN